MALDLQAFEPAALGREGADLAAGLLPELLVSFAESGPVSNLKDQLSTAETSATPMQRGFAIGRQLLLDLGYGDRFVIGAAVVADAGGVVGVRLFRRQTLRQQLYKGFAASAVRDAWLLPALDLVARQILTAHPAGPLFFDLWVQGLSEWELEWDLDSDARTRRHFGQDRGRTWIQAGAEAECTLAQLREVRAEGAAHPLIDVAARWARDLAREAGVAVYEP